jgi:hypothetical protein
MSSGMLVNSVSVHVPAKCRPTNRILDGTSDRVVGTLRLAGEEGQSNTTLFFEHSYTIHVLVDELLLLADKMRMSESLA